MRRGAAWAAQGVSLTLAGAAAGGGRHQWTGKGIEVEAVEEEAAGAATRRGVRGRVPFLALQRLLTGFALELLLRHEALHNGWFGKVSLRDES